MKTLKMKLSFAALFIALLGAGLSKVNAADELYRPDKQSGQRIDLADCQTPSNDQCGLLYHQNEDEPFDTVNGNYIGD